MNRARFLTAAAVCASLLHGQAVAHAAAPEPAVDGARTALVENPCPAPTPVDAATIAFVQTLVEPGAKFTPPPPLPKPENPMQDWANLCRYRADNAAVTARPDVVFMGDSLTELWKYADPAFFGAGRINRGISGQTSAQMLLRFQADVVALKPRVVHLLTGGNDIAGNAGLTSERVVKDNVIAMVTLARANDIKVVLGSITPIERVWWAPDLRPGGQVRQFNAWLRDYARANGLGFVDYHAALADGAGNMPAAYANDAAHPNRKGYALMEPAATRALDAALGK